MLHNINLHKSQINRALWSHEGPGSNNTPEEGTTLACIPLSYIQAHITKTTFQNTTSTDSPSQTWCPQHPWHVDLTISPLPQYKETFPYLSRVRPLHWNTYEIPPVETHNSTMWYYINPRTENTHLTPNTYPKTPHSRLIHHLRRSTKITAIEFLTRSTTLKTQ